MLLRVPETIDDPIWEGAVDPDEPVSMSHRSDPTAPTDVDHLRELPVVSIGRPESWRLADVYDADALPAPMRRQLTERSFTLYACRARPRPCMTGAASTGPASR